MSKIFYFILLFLSISLIFFGGTEKVSLISPEYWMILSGIIGIYCLGLCVDDFLYDDDEGDYNV